jgi:hypothetical protein
MRSLIDPAKDGVEEARPCEQTRSPMQANPSYTCEADFPNRYRAELSRRELVRAGLPPAAVEIVELDGGPTPDRGPPGLRARGGAGLGALAGALVGLLGGALLSAVSGVAAGPWVPELVGLVVCAVLGALLGWAVATAPVDFYARRLRPRWHRVRAHEHAALAGPILSRLGGTDAVIPESPVSARSESR